MNKSDYLTEVSDRLNKMFRASIEGYKIAAIDRHRLEGFMQAGIFMKVTTLGEMTNLMEQTHYTVFGKTIEERRSDKTISWPDIEIDYDKFDSPTYLR